MDLDHDTASPYPNSTRLLLRFSLLLNAMEYGPPDVRIKNTTPGNSPQPGTPIYHSVHLMVRYGPPSPC